MGPNDIPAKLKKIARAKERRARMDRSTAARGVRESEEELDALEVEHEASERRLLDTPPLDGEALAILGVGRQVHLEVRADTEEELASREETLRERTARHYERLRQRHGKDKLYERERQRRRAEIERKHQRAIDDLTSARRGRD